MKVYILFILVSVFPLSQNDKDKDEVKLKESTPKTESVKEVNQQMNQQIDQMTLLLQQVMADTVKMQNAKINHREVKLKKKTAENHEKNN